MRIVELDGHVFGELLDGPRLALVAEQDILQRRGGEEVLLLEAQFLARRRGVVRVEHARDVLDRVLLLHRQRVLLVVEEFEVELRQRRALPQAQRADVARAVADDGHVVGDGAHGLVGEGHRHLVRVAAAAPRVAQALPVVGRLVLEAVLERLLEQAVFVAQAVAVQRQVHRRGRIEEARRQPAEAAVAQRRVVNIFKHGQIQSAVGKRLPHLLEDAQREQIVVDHAAREVFRAEIVGAARALVRVAALIPVVRDRVHHDAAQRLVQLAGRRILQGDLVVALEHQLDLFHDPIDRHESAPSRPVTPAARRRAMPTIP